jgi:hypothetical protein
MSTSTAGPNPNSNDQWAALLGDLVGDAQRRRAAVACALRPDLAPIRGRIVESLIAFAQGDDEAVAHRAAASLADMGAIAVPALISAFQSARTDDLQCRLVRILGQMEPTLSPAEQTRLHRALRKSEQRANSMDVALAIAEILVNAAVRLGVPPRRLGKVGLGRAR